MKPPSGERAAGRAPGEVVVHTVVAQTVVAQTVVVETVVVETPAKLNFGLRILARRPDGYHEIESLMLPIDLCDTLQIRRGSRPGIELRCAGLPLPADASNLAVRGAAAACRALEVEPSFELELTKRIPVAAGLGGGSSDAAAALRGIERLAGRQIAEAQRLAIARALGADVAFFLEPRAVWARGVGERLEPLGPVPDLVWLLVALPFPVLTAEIYAAASRELTLPRAPSTIAPLSALASLSNPCASSTSEQYSAERISAQNGLARSSASPAGHVASPENDLERVTGRRHPEIGVVQLELRKLGATVTGMSGSGPTVFGNFANRAAAEEARTKAALPEGARTWVVTSPASGSLEPSWEPSWGVAKR